MTCITQTEPWHEVVAILYVLELQHNLQNSWGIWPPADTLSKKRISKLWGSLKPCRQAQCRNNSWRWYWWLNDLRFQAFTFLINIKQAYDSPTPSSYHHLPPTVWAKQMSLQSSLKLIFQNRGWYSVQRYVKLSSMPMLSICNDHCKDIDLLNLKYCRILTEMRTWKLLEDKRRSATCCRLSAHNCVCLVTKAELAKLDLIDCKPSSIGLWTSEAIVFVAAFVAPLVYLGRSLHFIHDINSGHARIANLMIWESTSFR